MNTTASFRGLFEMEQLGRDTWRAPNATNPWGRVYGGQVAAQGLWAAAQTVNPAFQPHSLHAFFIRGGAINEPVTYEIDEIRDGRSFVTRRVVATQSHGVILNLSTSFHRPEPAPDTTTISIPADVPPADQLPAADWTPMLSRRVANSGQPRARTWLRVNGTEDHRNPLLQAIGHTFASDDLPTEAVEIAHPLGAADYGNPNAKHPYMGASLDHSIWFHRLAPASNWTLHDMRSSGVSGARGHAIGEMWTADGTHIATIAQEVLLRVAR